jgi:hypothetical protein
MSETPPLPRFPGGPDPEQPIVDTPVDGVSMELFAQISAELAEHCEPRRATFERHGLGEARWMGIEKTWMLRLATALMKREPALAERYDALYAAAQDQLGGQRPAPSLDEFAALTKRLRSGEDGAVAIAAAGLSLADWSRAQRHYGGLFARDAAARTEFEERLSGAPPRDMSPTAS